MARSINSHRVQIHVHTQEASPTSEAEAAGWWKAVGEGGAAAAVPCRPEPSVQFSSSFCDGYCRSCANTRLPSKKQRTLLRFRNGCACVIATQCHVPDTTRTSEVASSVGKGAGEEGSPRPDVTTRCHSEESSDATALPDVAPGVVECSDCSSDGDGGTSSSSTPAPSAFDSMRNSDTVPAGGPACCSALAILLALELLSPPPLDDLNTDLNAALKNRDGRRDDDDDDEDDDDAFPGPCESSAPASPEPPDVASGRTDDAAYASTESLVKTLLSMQNHDVNA